MTVDEFTAIVQKNVPGGFKLVISTTTDTATFTSVPHCDDTLMAESGEGIRIPIHLIEGGSEDNTFQLASEVLQHLFVTNAERERLRTEAKKAITQTTDRKPRKKA